VQIVDSDQDGKISKEEMHKFFASIFAVLMVFSDNTQGLDTDYLRSKVHRAAQESTDGFFEIADLNLDGLIDYKEFVKVYQDHPDIVSWLHLFDSDSPLPQQGGQVSESIRDLSRVQKSFSDADTQSTASHVDVGVNTSQPLSERDEKSKIDEAQPDVSVTIPITSKGDSLEMTAWFYAGFGILKTYLHGLTPVDIVGVFHQVAPTGAWDSDTYTQVMKILLPADACNVLQVQIDNLAALFSRSASAELSGEEFCAALYLLCTADPSEKLLLAFIILDRDNDGFISYPELSVFFYSIFSILVAFAADELVPFSEMRAVVVGAAVEKATLFWNELNSKRHMPFESKINLEEFVSAYRDHPGPIDWLYVLSQTDLEEFILQQVHGHAANVASQAAEAALAGDELSQVSSVPSRVNLESALNSSGRSESGSEFRQRVFEYRNNPETSSVQSQGSRGNPDVSQGSNSDVQSHVSSPDDIVVIPLSADNSSSLQIPVRDIANFSLFRSVPSSVEELSQVFSAYASENDKISFDSFFPAMQTLLKDHDERTMPALRYIINTLFGIFDRDGDGAIDRAEFMSGMCLLSAVSVEDKIKLSFSVVDANGDGFISMGELFNFFYSLFALLVTLSNAAVGLPPAVMQSLLEKAASWRTEDFFHIADTDRDGLVSFVDYCTAYSAHSHLISWLYLFDAAAFSRLPRQVVGQEPQGEYPSHWSLPEAQPHAPVSEHRDYSSDSSASPKAAVSPRDGTNQTILVQLDAAGSSIEVCQLF
jgi:Ca2+-binding EF-hand superfamily protein